jgi:uncharacterized protein YjbI with pentapeptide repeats
MSHGPTTVDPGAAFEAVLAIARREVLLLVVAAQAEDWDAAAITAARLRWALASAGELAERTPDSAVHAARVASLHHASALWLPTKHRLDLTAATLERFLERMRGASGDGDGVIDASSTILDELDLDGLQLARMALRQAEVTRVSAQGARLDWIDAVGANIVQCRFETASMAMAILDDVMLEDCDLSRINLQRASLRGANMVRCRAGGSVLADTRLNHAVFTDCDLRGADFSVRRAASILTVVGARFVRCDLRETNWSGRCLNDVSFIDCKFYGAHGAPQLESVTIVHPDLSRDADGTEIRTVIDVVAGWATLIGKARE